MATKNLTIRIDENLKKQADAFFEDMGLSLSTAINIFLKASIRKNKIPFDIEGDPFYSPANIEYLEKEFEKHKKGIGKYVTFTSEEWEDFVNAQS